MEPDTQNTQVTTAPQGQEQTVGSDLGSWRQEIESKIQELSQGLEGWRNAAQTAYSTLQTLYSTLQSMSESTQSSESYGTTTGTTTGTTSQQPPSVWEFDPFDESHRRYLGQVLSTIHQYANTIRDLYEKQQRYEAALNLLQQVVIPTSHAIGLSMSRDLIRLFKEDPDVVLDDKQFEKVVQEMARNQVYSFKKAYESAFQEKLTKKQLENLRRQVEEEIRAQMVSGAVRTSENGPSRYAPPSNASQQIQELAKRLLAR